MKECRSLPPILIKKAKGMKLYDDKGNFYYDTISSWWCNVHGHNHPNIKRAIKKQLDSLEHVLFAGFTHRPAILLTEKLISITPKNLTKVFFSDNGSTAVETALKISFQYWQNIGKRRKKRFIFLDYAYHGDTIGTMSVSGVDLFSKVFSPLFFRSFKVPSPYCYRCPMGKERSTCKLDCIQPLEKMLKDKNGEIAAMIIEPLILAVGGMVVYPVEYLKRVRELTKKYNVHLILDEVATGFGRTGNMFACEYAGIKPDFICLSKGITAGYLPLGATLTTDKVYQAFYADYKKRKTFYHGHTYTANPISCTAALASLKIFEKENTLDKVRRLAPEFHRRLEEFRTLPIVGDVRYIGMIGALELVKDKGTKRLFDLEERIGLKVYREGLRRNLILRPLGNIIYLYLPLGIKESELKTVLKNTYESVRTVSADVKKRTNA
jgi:adenosylmethionine-8-amino-7-oxononanoate aminotransferase